LREKGRGMSQKTIVLTTLSCATTSLHEIWLNAQKNWLPDNVDGLHLPLFFNKHTKCVEAVSDECRIICASEQYAWWASADSSACKEAIRNFCRDCCEALTKIQVEQRASLPLPTYLLVTYRKRCRGEDQRGSVPHIDAGLRAGCDSEEVEFVMFSLREFPPTSILPRRFAVNVDDPGIQLSRQEKKRLAERHVVSPLGDPGQGVLLSQALWAHRSSPTLGDPYLERLERDGVLPEPLFRVLWCKTTFNSHNMFAEEKLVTVEGLREASLSRATLRERSRLRERLSKRRRTGDR
jgi:hypothetical protein